MTEFNKNYINHNFIPISTLDNGRFYICSKCKIELDFIGTSKNPYVKRINNGELVIETLILSCEEEIIKNIIE